MENEKATASGMESATGSCPASCCVEPVPVDDDASPGTCALRATGLMCWTTLLRRASPPPGAQAPRTSPGTPRPVTRSPPSPPLTCSSLCPLPDLHPLVSGTFRGRVHPLRGGARIRPSCWRLSTARAAARAGAPCPSPCPAPCPRACAAWSDAATPPAAYPPAGAALPSSPPTPRALALGTVCGSGGGGARNSRLPPRPL
mmetsp:Transcript_49310/g.91804  ORF Transcript_49310/g.91804 Transcript_49310/m.91804 type:complete len:201 (-) Transcript_49310:129-731(-)